MDSTTISGWILFALLSLSIVFFTYYGQKKTQGLVSYLTASKSYGPVTIGLTLGATTCSAAATLGNPGLVFTNGWPALWYAFGYGGAVVAWALVAFKLTKISALRQSKSLPDFMAVRFQSNYMRVITAVATLALIYYVAGQFAGTGWIFESVLNIPYSYGVILSSAIIAIYVIIGGSHAEILNTAIQGAIMIGLVIFVSVFVLYFVGTPSSINEKLIAQDPALGWNVVFADPSFGVFTGPGIMISLALFSLTPQISKMWFALRDEREIPKALLVGLLFMFGMGLLMWLGGLGARVLVPDAAPDISVVEMISIYMPGPIVAAAGIAILAAIMSTTSGLFMVIGIAAVNDLIREIVMPRLSNSISEERADWLTLLGTRISIPITMFIAVVIAFNPPESLTALMWVGIGGFAGGISPILIIGCLWRRITKHGAIVGSTLGFSTHLFCYFVIGQMIGVEVFTVPWAGSTVAVIISTLSCVVVSLFTKPFSKEHLDEVFPTNSKQLDKTSSSTSLEG